MTPAEASRTARQLVALLDSADHLASDLLNRDALNRAHTLIVLAQRLAVEVQDYCDEQPRADTGR